MNPPTPPPATDAASPASFTAADWKCAILESLDLQPFPVDTPEWAPSGLPQVWARPLSGDELASLANLPEGANELRTVVGKVLCTPDGAPLGFTDAEMVLLGKKSAGALRRIYRAVMDKSGLSDTARGEIEGNSPTEDDATG